MEQYDHVRAIFQPRHQDTLKPGAVELIGQEFRFEVLWKIEEGSTYVGEWAMGFTRQEDARLQAVNADFFWVPSGDLQILEVLELTWVRVPNGLPQRVYQPKQT